MSLELGLFMKDWSIDESRTRTAVLGMNGGEKRLKPPDIR